jgi:hypothetical protein
MSPAGACFGASFSRGPAAIFKDPDGNAFVPSSR